MSRPLTSTLFQALAIASSSLPEPPALGRLCMAPADPDAPAAGGSSLPALDPVAPTPGAEDVASLTWGERVESLERSARAKDAELAALRAQLKRSEQAEAARKRAAIEDYCADLQEQATSDGTPIPVPHLDHVRALMTRGDDEMGRLMGELLLERASRASAPSPVKVRADAEGTSLKRLGSARELSEAERGAEIEERMAALGRDKHGRTIGATGRRR